MSEYISRIRYPERKNSYRHFDLPVSYRDVAEKIEDPQYVARHSFYPLIGSTLHNRTYGVVEPDEGDDAREGNRKKGDRNKDREVAYASHTDSKIYQLYSLIWSDLYEKELRRRGLDREIAAFRRGNRESNITAAKRVIDYVRRTGDCFLVVGDYSNFFGSLDHDYVMRSLRDLFEGYIPSDSYAVLKSVLHYSVWPLENLLALDGFNVEDSSKKAFRWQVKEFNARRFTPALNNDAFRKNKHDSIVSPWKDGHSGIPQGLAVSGVLSNIYMIDADFQVSKIVKDCNGLYSRYCDDFVIAVPWEDARVALSAFEVLKGVGGVQLNDKKTRKYRIAQGCVVEASVLDKSVFSGDCSKTVFSYLGFDFDGSTVSLRQRTISRYMNRYKKNLDIVVARKGMRRGSKKRRRKLYDRFTPKGSRRKRRANGEVDYRSGNFLTYVNAAQRAFPKDPIARPFRKAYHQIRRVLDFDD